jgi:predicted esterase
MRLYLADFLPAEQRKAGYNKLVNDLIAAAEPGPALKGLPVWVMNGTLDEVLPPKLIDEMYQALGPHLGKYRIARIEDFHHSIESRQSIVIGKIWLRVIDEGFFD